MAVYGEVVTFTAKAAADLSGVQYHIVRFSGADTVNIASQDTSSEMCGVLQNKPSAADQHAAVGFLGESKVVAGAAVSANAFITTNGSGRAVAATSGDMVCGRALEAASADGEVIRCLLNPPFRWSGAV